MIEEATTEIPTHYFTETFRKFLRNEQIYINKELEENFKKHKKAAIHHATAQNII